jgi:hypothetical protein
MQKDKKKALKWIIGYVIAALIFHLAWFNQLVINYHSGWFAGVDVILWLLFAALAIAWFKDAEDEFHLWLPYAVFGVAVALIVWSASWSVALMDRVTAPVKTEQVDTTLQDHSRIPAKWNQDDTIRLEMATNSLYYYSETEAKKVDKLLHQQ